MKAMIIQNFGGSNVFEPAEITKPEVKPGHVLVNIAATSINTVDTMIREIGSSLPICRIIVSTGLTLVAATRTSTWPGLTSSLGSSADSNTSGPPKSRMIIAFIVRRLYSSKDIGL